MGGNTKCIKDGVEYMPSKLKVNKNALKEISQILKELNIEEYYSGSTSLFFNNYDDIIKHKQYMGDVDVMVDKEKVKYYIKVIRSHHKYKCDNINIQKPGNTLIALFKLDSSPEDELTQFDFELLDFKDNKPTEWSMFSHSSHIEDATIVKAVFHKHLLRALVGMSHIKKAVVFTPSSTKENPKLKSKQPPYIRLYNFGVDSGVGQAYEKINDVMYRELRKNKGGIKGEVQYNKDLDYCAKIALDKNATKCDIMSLERIIKYVQQNEICKVHKQLVFYRFYEIVFGIGCQAQPIEDNAEDDIAAKLKAYHYVRKAWQLDVDECLEDTVEKYLERVWN